MTILASDAIKDSYNKEGYIIIDNVLSENEVEYLRTVIESEDVKQSLKNIGISSIYESVHITDITLLHPAIKKLAYHPKIVTIVQSLIGENIQLHHSMFGNKPPKEESGAVNWHKDYPYWPHTNTDILAVMVPLDHMTPENGCLQVKPRSHKEPITCTKYVMDNDTFYSDPRYSHIEITNSKDIKNLLVKTGGVSIHHCLTTHASAPNMSDRPRRVIILQYRADDCYQLAGRLFHDTGTLIAGKKQHLVRCDVGTIDIPIDLQEPDFDIDHPETSWHQDGKNCS